MNRTWETLACFCMASVAGVSLPSSHARTAATLDQPAISIGPGVLPGAPAPGRQEIGLPPNHAPGTTDAPPGPAKSPANSLQTEEIARLRARALAPSSTPGRASPEQASAAWLLGLLYLHGIGVNLDRAEAESWFVRAEAQGNALAAAGLAWCEIEGCSKASNPAAARRWISRLRAGNSSRALYLQWLLENRMAPLQQGTGSAARQLLLRAAASGDVQARLELGLTLAGANRLAEALEQFSAAAPRSQAAAANAERIRERLQLPAVQASRANEGPAAAADTLAKARRNHRGDGQPANYVEAIRLYRLAQSQGSVEARKMLELIFSRPGPDGAVDTQWMQQLANINLGSQTLQLDSAPERRLLLREPTGLSDLLPAEWRRQLKQSQVGG